MTQWLYALAAPAEDLLQYSIFTSSGSLVLVTIAQEDHMPSSNLHREAQMCAQMCVYAHIHIYMYAYMWGGVQVCMCTYIKKLYKCEYY